MIEQERIDYFFRSFEDYIKNGNEPVLALSLAASDYGDVFFPKERIVPKSEIDLQPVKQEAAPLTQEEHRILGCAELGAQLRVREDASTIKSRLKWVERMDGLKGKVVIVNCVCLKEERLEVIYEQTSHHTIWLFDVRWLEFVNPVRGEAFLARTMEAVQEMKEISKGFRSGKPLTEEEQSFLFSLVPGKEVRVKKNITDTRHLYLTWAKGMDHLKGRILLVAPTRKGKEWKYGDIDLIDPTEGLFWRLDIRWLEVVDPVSAEQ